MSKQQQQQQQQAEARNMPTQVSSPFPVCCPACLACVSDSPRLNCEAGLRFCGRFRHCCGCFPIFLWLSVFLFSFSLSFFFLFDCSLANLTGLRNLPTPVSLACHRLRLRRCKLGQHVKLRLLVSLLANWPLATYKPAYIHIYRIYILCIC